MADELREGEGGNWIVGDMPDVAKTIQRMQEAKIASGITISGSCDEEPMMHFLVGVEGGGDVLASFSVPEAREIAEQIFEGCNHILERNPHAGKRRVDPE